ncbi:MAG: ABC transporter ATP-binding protein [Spirochaetes bacterium]|nr:ABC transporter ATP-binding protein [Spirochaetota bacterium]
MGTQQKKETIDVAYNMRVYLGFLKPYRVMAVVILLVSSAIEASLTLDRYFFKRVIDEGTRFAEKTMAVSDFSRFLVFILIAFGSVVIIRALLKWLHLHLIIRLESQAIRDLKNHFFSHIVTRSHEFHTTHKSGSLIARLSRGGRAIEMMTDIFVFEFAPLIFQLVTVCTAFAFLDARLAVAVVLTAVAFVIFSISVQRVQRIYNILENNADDAEKALVGDVFTNIDSITYYGKESSIVGTYAAFTDRTRTAQSKHWNFDRITQFGHTVILGAGTIVVVALPMQSFLAHTMTLGNLVFVYTIFGNLAAPLMGFVRGFRNYYRAMADFESLFRYGKIEQTVKDAPGAPKLVINDGRIAFSGVTFAYHHKRTIFSDFSLAIRPGEKVALVGASGSGKTTLIKLLYRMYDVGAGSITVDGVDIRTVAQRSLRSEMAIVPQECVLFDDTIFNNIKFSKPEATCDEVMKAIGFAQLDHIIEQFPQKEETIVGERGVRLSGGEKQRVSIARAVLADRRIVVLDEATSSLDSQTEHEIQRDLKRLLEGRTSIIIAHRLSTIMNADRVVVLRHGAIVQTGRHADLIAEEGVYKTLWNLQKNGYIS